MTIVCILCRVRCWVGRDGDGRPRLGLEEASSWRNHQFSEFAYRDERLETIGQFLARLTAFKNGGTGHVIVIGFFPTPRSCQWPASQGIYCSGTSQEELVQGRT